MKNKEIKLWSVGTVLVGLIACSQAVEAQNIVKVELDGTTGIKALLGESINEADSLVVSGKMTFEDLRAVSMASIYGRLTGVDIKNVELDNNALPARAFFGVDEIYVNMANRVNSDNKDEMPLAKFRYISLPDNLEAIGQGAFNMCYDLQYVNLPASLKELGAGSFMDCGEIFKGVNIDIPVGVTAIHGSCFSGCEGIAGVNLPDGLKSIDAGAFKGCGGIVNINLPDGLEYIGSSAFEGCSGIVNINLPDGLECIESSTFEGCSGLVGVNLPDGLKRIEDSAFEGCSFKDIIFPESLEYIGKNAFICYKDDSYGKKVRANVIRGKIYSKAVVPPVCGGNNKGEWPFVGDEYYHKLVYVPVGHINDYRRAPGWNVFSEFFEIREFPTTGLTELAMPNVDAAVYDLQGNKVTAPVKGQIYISEGKKFIAR